MKRFGLKVSLLGLVIHELQGQAKTLSNQIASYNAQITLAELKVQQTEAEIELLGGRIDQVGASLQALSQAFAAPAGLSFKMGKTKETALFKFERNPS